jgi:peptidoglycan/xylan/chitin deacetylase (PgdA/CDA1 family)
VSLTPEDDVSTPTPTAPAQVAAQVQPGPQGAHLSVPILLYHYVRFNPVASDQVGFELSVTPPNFALQMGFLRWIGAHTLSLADLRNALASGRPLPPRSVVLTFDDGYTNFATVAAPVMHHDGLMGTVFVVSGFIGRNGYMNAAQVLQAQAMGMVIGCHTVNHVDLAAVPLAIARTQIDVAHQALDALTGHDVRDFAYPYGGFNGAVEKLVQADGFADAVTTEWGATELQSQAMAWPRMRIGGHDSIWSFAGKALAGMPAAQVNALVRAYLASPASSSSGTALPAAHDPTAMGDPQGGDDRRLV